MIRDRLTAENEIVAALRRIVRAIDQHSRQLLDGYGLTGPQLAVLQESRRCHGGTAAALARAVHLSRPTVTGILDRLEKRGLVHRAPDPRDRRSSQVTVTSAGERMLDRAPSLLQDRFRQELAGLQDWEQTQILSTLQRIATMMDADALPASPILTTGPMEPETLSAAPGLPAPLNPEETS